MPWMNDRWQLWHRYLDLHGEGPVRAVGVRPEGVFTPEVSPSAWASLFGAMLLGVAAVVGRGMP